MGGTSQLFVAECFWPDVCEQDVRELDVRIRAAAAGNADVRYLGSLLIRPDEVVLCQFEGAPAAIRSLAQLAGIPFERLLESTTPDQQRSRNDA
jgi:hypothetical protein